MNSRLCNWFGCDELAKALWVLKLDREREKFFDVHVEHVTALVDDALVHKLALKIDANATRNLEGDFEALATEDRYTDESILCALENGDLAKQLSDRNQRSVCYTHADRWRTLSSEEWAKAVESVQNAEQFEGS